MPNQKTKFENIVAKGEIAPMEQFLLLPQCFHLYLGVSFWIVPTNDVYKEIDEMLSAPEFVHLGMG